MTKKCLGCGINLQVTNINEEGYIKELTNNLCERCFRIKNYNDYQTITKTNNDFIPILKKIAASKDLVILVIDILNIPANIDLIKNNIRNDILLVFSKRDLLPADIYEDKVLTNAAALGINFVDKVFVGSRNNYHLDDLLFKIRQYKKSNNVYVIGYTNAGKSTLINKLIYNYSDLNYTLTTSNLPSTTLDMINIKINDDLTIIDTPGLVMPGSIFEYLSNDTLKKIASSKTIYPKVYQIKSLQSFKIENFFYLIGNSNKIVFYIPDTLKIERLYKEIKNANWTELTFNIKEKTDIVITGLGFIKVINPGPIKVICPPEIIIYTRKSIIN